MDQDWVDDYKSTHEQETVTQDEWDEQELLGEE
jgi:hypothetical protein